KNKQVSNLPHGQLTHSKGQSMATSSKFLAPIVCSTLIALFGLAQEKVNQRAEDLQQKAKTFVARLSQGEFAKGTEDFDATMRNVLPADELQKTWAKVQAGAGEFKRQLGARQEKTDRFEVVYVTCEFAKTKLEARIVFGQSG